MLKKWTLTFYSLFGFYTTSFALLVFRILWSDKTEKVIFKRQVLVNMHRPKVSLTEMKTRLVNKQFKLFKQSKEKFQGDLNETKFKYVK